MSNYSIVDKILKMLCETDNNQAGVLTLHVTTETHFSLRKSLKNIMHCLVKMYVMR